MSDTRLRGPRRGSVQLARLVVTLLVASGFLVLASSSAVTEAVLSRFPEYAPVLRRLPSYEGQSGTIDLGRLGSQIDAAAIRRAAEVVPDDALYYVHAPERFALGVRRVAQLHFLPAVAVRDPLGADWVLAFRSPTPPKGLAEVQSIALSPDLRLVRVVRSRQPPP